MAKRNISIILGLALLLSAFAMLLSLGLRVAEVSGIPRYITAPGSFLFERFLFASFYLPIFLSVLGYIALKSGYQRSALEFMILSLLPFVTAALLFHVLLNAEPNGLMRFFIIGFGGRRSAAGVLLLLMVVESLLGFRLTFGRTPFNAGGREPEEEDDGLYPLREHIDLSVEEELPAISDEESPLHPGDDALQLDRDGDGRLRFTASTAAAVEVEEVEEFEPLDQADLDEEEEELREIEAADDTQGPVKAVELRRATGETAEGHELREIVPEGDPGSLDELYSSDSEDPSIRSLVQDIINSRVSAPLPPAVSPAIPEVEAVPEEFDLEEIELYEDDLENPGELSIPQDESETDEYAETLTGLYEQDIPEEDQLNLLEEKYGDEFDENPVPVSPDEETAQEAAKKKTEAFRTGA